MDGCVETPADVASRSRLTDGRFLSFVFFLFFFGSAPSLGFHQAMLPGFPDLPGPSFLVVRKLR